VNTEYRLTVARPKHRNAADPTGRKIFYWSRRDEAHARLSLEQHRHDRPGWDAWIETRQVTPWTRLDEPASEESCGA
jgi:hypothetical protein